MLNYLSSDQQSDLLKELDSKGRTLLHEAVRSKASPAMLRCILGCLRSAEEKSGLMELKDEAQVTVFHLATLYLFLH